MQGACLGATNRGAEAALVGGRTDTGSELAGLNGVSQDLFHAGIVALAAGADAVNDLLRQAKADMHLRLVNRRPADPLDGNRGATARLPRVARPLGVDRRREARNTTSPAGPSVWRCHVAGRSAQGFVDASAWLLRRRTE